MTVAGVITVIGLFLALGYALKQRPDNIVYRAWAWLFFATSGSTAAVANNAPPEHYVYWYGVPALAGMGAVIYRFAACHCTSWRSLIFAGLFGFNTLALEAGLEGVQLGFGVSVLTATVWVQIVMLFLLARAHPCEEVEHRDVREQVEFGGKKKDNVAKLSPQRLELWWWDWLYSSIQAKYGHIMKQENDNNRTAG